MHRYATLMRVDARNALYAEISASPLIPEVLTFLRADQMCAISQAIKGVEARSLVDLRYRLAQAFVEQIKTMAGDQPKPNRSERRKAVSSIAGTARKLRVLLAGYTSKSHLRLFMDEHYEALFFGGKGPDWSPLYQDYENLLSAVENIEAIAQCVLSVPPVGRGSTESPYLPGYPSDRIDNPGTCASIAFARRIGLIYFDLTGKKPAVGRDSQGPYQRLVAVVWPIFSSAYKAAGERFGPAAPPSRGDMDEACRLIPVPKSDLTSPVFRHSKKSHSAP